MPAVLRIRAEFVTFALFMTGKDLLAGLSSYLFWDVDRNSVDAEENASYIIQRVLEYGQLSDWRLVSEYYGMEKIVSKATALPSLEPKAMSFICCLAGIPETQFRCYTTKQSLPRHWNF